MFVETWSRRAHVEKLSASPYILPELFRSLTAVPRRGRGRERERERKREIERDMEIIEREPARERERERERES